MSLSGCVTRTRLGRRRYARQCLRSGKLQRWTRSEAAELVRRAGGHVQAAVGDSTTLLVRGDVRNGLNESEGRKLYAVRERLRLGQRISIVGQTGLERLLGQRHG